MTYFAPYIDASGLHIPSYIDIENLFISQAQALFGADIVLDASSQDMQDIAARAQAAYDAFLGLQQAYNNFSPASAVGAGLDMIVALNGVIRKSASYSIVNLTLTGTPFTVVSNGVVSDLNGNKWNLPASVTIGSGGTLTVTATCAASGAVSALAGQVTTIQTPTAGWSSVTNTYAATPGQPVELDSDLRGRQAASVAAPSQALTTGILGAVLDVSGVTAAQLYENDTSSPVATINGVSNPGNFPANSLTLVVNGGADADIASAVALRKTPGCYLAGDQVYNRLDRYGIPTVVRFYRPSQTTIDVGIPVKALTGFTDVIELAIRQAVVNYINSLVAGQNVYQSELWYAAMAINTNSRTPTFAIQPPLTLAIHGNSLTASDVVINFQQQAVSTLANVSVNLV